MIAASFILMVSLLVSACGGYTQNHEFSATEEQSLRSELENFALDCSDTSDCQLVQSTIDSCVPSLLPVSHAHESDFEVSQTLQGFTSTSSCASETPAGPLLQCGYHGPQVLVEQCKVGCILGSCMVKAIEAPTARPDP